MGVYNIPPPLSGSLGKGEYINFMYNSSPDCQTGGKLYAPNATLPRRDHLSPMQCLISFAKASLYTILFGLYPMSVLFTL